jgi:nicotinamide-nucleotide amidase
VLAARPVAERAAAGARAEGLAQRAVGLLAEQRLWLATAESLTGGLLAAALTDVPGASRVFRGGVVAYATDLKHELLGVDADLLRRVGAVDAEVAAQLAEGARRRLAADIAVATTGVAGPDPQDAHPPGTVFIALAAADGVRTLDASVSGAEVGARAQVRRRTVEAALQALVEHLER